MPADIMEVALALMAVAAAVRLLFHHLQQQAPIHKE